MCERCEEAKKRLTPEQCQELDELNENVGRLRQRIDELRGDPSNEEMQRRFMVVNERLDLALTAFVKDQLQQGTFGPEGQYRAALFCPVLMLHACRLALMAGFDIEDTIQMFGSELQAALAQQSGEMMQKLQLMRIPRGDGMVH